MVEEYWLCIFESFLDTFSSARLQFFAKSENKDSVANLDENGNLNK